MSNKEITADEISKAINEGEALGADYAAEVWISQDGEVHRVYVTCGRKKCGYVVTDGENVVCDFLRIRASNTKAERWILEALDS